MAEGEAVQAVSRTSVHEDIIREAEETDWTVDPNEEECNLSSLTANVSSSKDDQVNQGRDKENGEDDVEFDPDELECVDEDADDERREKERIREDHKHSERQRRDAKKHRHLDSRHEVERHHPYSHHERDDRREFKTCHATGRHRSEPTRLRKPYDPRCRRVEVCFIFFSCYIRRNATTLCKQQ
ncbi:hypothetical protein OESDEN_03829 [Oesophagostomum dentatum]|uniref:Uncharacterized protein n=1 Tax=Oesophagostomum dentatum TaxID=61180 RepID=A0A0B1TG55_OESDE|nr:hypothetical protein OESDEN_03829 [Oesophagostomum dentatum]